MSLQAKLDAFKAQFENGGPPFNIPTPVVETFHRAVAELIASGAASKAPRVGDRAPSFALKGTEGNLVSSADLLAEGPIVVTFYRGGWCPYCNTELQALQAAHAAIRAAGGTLLAITPQTHANSRKVIDDHKLEFPVLWDPMNEVAASFGLRYEAPAYLVELFKTLKVNLPMFNGDDSWTLPMPARFVVSRDGLVRYAEVNPDYTTRPEPEDVLPALREEAAKAA